MPVISLLVCEDGKKGRLNGVNMSTFSQRYGHKSSVLQLEAASDTLKRRILAAFYKQEFDSYDTIDWTNYTTGIEDMMIEMGVPYEFPKNESIKKRNAEALQKYVMEAKEWYVIFDFIERYFMNSEKETVEKMRTVFNRILEEEVSGYRIMGKLVVPIVSEHELKSLEEAANIPYDSARAHIRKAVDSFSNRKAPDYENTIKDSISAVEAMCCIITENPKATLGEALKKLESKGVKLHKALQSAMSSLYGYTSDEGGIRHGSIDFAGASSEDAKYMLISCSAFVNYLIEKWEKVK